jgi:[histone H3]-trimethyl-L-lysine9/36 demethylase
MSSTTCPVFTPTMEEFQDFYQYIQQLEEKCIDVAICKVIPPNGWYEHTFNLSSVSSMVIKNPVRQLVNSTKAGVYSTHLFDINNMTIADFMRFAEMNKCDESVLDRERKFWRNLGSSVKWADPIYGADMLGSLFGEHHASSWNLNKIHSVLRLLESDIPGVNSSMLYVGTWRSFFAFHVEDLNLYSINYLHTGEPKSWYGISPEHKLRFESMSDSFHPEDARDCGEYLRHKTKLFSPYKLKEFGIPYSTALQSPGEFIITFPGAYHAGFNHGFNIAEATNFATPSWFEIGKLAKSCKCMPWSVKMNVHRLETLYYRKLTIKDRSSITCSSISPISDHEDNRSIVCFCKKPYSYQREKDDDDIVEDDQTSAVYTCKDCLVPCHAACLEDEIPGISAFTVCHICYDINQSSTSIHGPKQSKRMAPLMNSTAPFQQVESQTFPPAGVITTSLAGKRLRNRSTQTISFEELRDNYTKLLLAAMNGAPAVKEHKQPPQPHPPLPTTTVATATATATNQRQSNPRPIPDLASAYPSQGNRQCLYIPWKLPDRKHPSQVPSPSVIIKTPLNIPRPQLPLPSPTVETITRTGVRRMPQPINCVEPPAKVGTVRCKSRS